MPISAGRRSFFRQIRQSILEPPASSFVTASSLPLASIEPTLGKNPWPPRPYCCLDWPPLGPAGGRALIPLLLAADRSMVTRTAAPPEGPIEGSRAGSIYLVRNATRNRVVASQVRLAGVSRERRLGLSRHAHLGIEEGLLLTPCEAIHTFGMRFAIDVLFLAPSGKVCGLRHGLPPWRIAASWRARSTLELAAGTVRQSATEIGDLLEFLPGADGAGDPVACHKALDPPQAVTLRGAPNLQLAEPVALPSDTP
jgi:uncharacterized protein